MNATAYPFTPPDGRPYLVHAVFLEGKRRVVRPLPCSAEILRLAEAVREFRADAEAFAADRDREAAAEKKADSDRQGSLDLGGGK